MTTRPGTRGIGILSKQTGCNVETIRYYERIGLGRRALLIAITPSRKTRPDERPEVVGPLFGRPS